MTDFMLTLSGSNGLRDVQVNNAGDIREAIQLAERTTGCRVSHGRAGVGSRFDPALIIDAETGEATEQHDRVAIDSAQVAPARSMAD